MLFFVLTLSVPVLQVKKWGAASGRGHPWWRGAHFPEGWGEGDAGPPGGSQKTPDSASPAEMQTQDPEIKSRTQGWPRYNFCLQGVQKWGHVSMFLLVLNISEYWENSLNKFRPGRSLHKASWALFALLNLPWLDCWKPFLATWYIWIDTNVLIHQKFFTTPEIPLPWQLTSQSTVWRLPPACRERPGWWTSSGSLAAPETVSPHFPLRLHPSSVLDLAPLWTEVPGGRPALSSPSEAVVLPPRGPMARVKASSDKSLQCCF